MSPTTKQSSYLQIIVVVITVALMFSVVFFTYNFENLPTFGISLISESSLTNCSNVKMEGKINKQDKQNDLIILIWMWPFGYTFDLNCDKYNVYGCFLTDDKSLYSKAHAVMFHHVNIHADLSEIPTEPRPSFQKWVWYNMESPSTSNEIEGLNNLFNLTCTFRRDSDIFTPYGSLVPISEEDGLFIPVPTKDKLVCWIVSHWSPDFQRVPFFNEFKQHIEIETYGTAFGKRITDDQYFEIMKSCKFYLAFENNIYKDYITEKFFMPLQQGAVPVVLGPPRQEYELHAPGDAFIHVDDFPSPKELAEKLKYLDQHPDEYMAYFEWKKRYRSVKGKFGHEHVCRTCHYLKTQNRHQTFYNLNRWYWS